jgi:hypothetical protein
VRRIVRQRLDIIPSVKKSGHILVSVDGAQRRREVHEREDEEDEDEVEGKKPWRRNPETVSPRRKVCALR